MSDVFGGGGTPNAMTGLVTHTPAAGGFGGGNGGVAPTIGPGTIGIGTGNVPLGSGDGVAFPFQSVIPQNAGAPGVNEPSPLEQFLGAGTQGSNFGISQSFVDPNQQGFLDALRTAGLDVAGSQLEGITDFAFPFAQQLLGGGTALLESLGSGAFAQPLQDFELNNSLIEDQISALGTDIDTQLQEFLGGAGGLGSEFVLGGTLGGGRQQVQEGIATRGATDAFAREAAKLRGADAAQRQRLGLDQATSLAQLFGQGQTGALGSLQDIFNLGISPFDAQFGPLQALADLIGDPTRLTEEFSQGTTGSSGGSGNLGDTVDLAEFIKGLFP